MNKRKKRYRLYIDESGDHGYGRLEDQSYRYLALLGVWFEFDKSYPKFADDMEQFKRSIFGARPDDPVHLHRKDAVCRTGPFARLNDDGIRQRFDDGLVAMVSRAGFKATCVVIDKKKHLDSYADAAFHPYHYCLAALLDRYCGWLNYKNAIGDVMAESRGGSADRQLKEAYRSLHRSGTLMFGPDFHSRVLTSIDLKLKTKLANIAGLQLADILVHPLKHDMFTRRGIVVQRRGRFGPRLAEAATPKLNRNEFRGEITGYGRVWV